MPVETPSVDDATDVIVVGDLSSPVFVDASGRRRKRIRIVFGVLGAATLIYGALVATSLAGGPLKPQQLVPFPELVNNLPVLDQQQPTSQPGAKSTPGARQPVVSTAKKINNRPSPGGAQPVPSGAPTTPGPGATTTTAPPAESTDAPPQPSATPSNHPSPTPTRTGQPDPTVSATATPRTSEAGTALPGATPTARTTHTQGTVPVGETSTARPSATPMVSAPGGTGETTGTAAGAGAGATPAATASLGLA
ncbi:hypothetical protein [Dactylosporangium sp. CA-233914]|uniref:hypothetical protein n=1 Tax=Dactylosporangium sp. CA-233914 TaxID=3239934 RepID=UPI003D94CDFF